MKQKFKLFTGLILWALFAGTAYASSSPVTITVCDAECDPDASEFSVDINVDDPQYILGAAFTIRYDTDYLTLTSVESSFFDTFAEQFDAVEVYNDPPESVTVDDITYNRPLVTGPESADIGGTRIAGVRARSAGNSNTTLFTLYFSPTGLQYGDTFSITVEPTVIDDTDAGYDASGEETPMLITQTGETSFEEIEVAGIVAGTVTVTDVDTPPGSDDDDDDNTVHDTDSKSGSGDCFIKTLSGIRENEIFVPVFSGMLLIALGMLVRLRQSVRRIRFNNHQWKLNRSSLNNGGTPCIKK